MSETFENEGLVYTLRASPIDGVGGVYATWNGNGDVVTVAAQVPSTAERQFWKIRQVKGKKGIVTIVHETSGGSLGGGWAEVHKVSVPSGPVIAKEDADEWHIDHLFEKGIDVVHIRPVTDAVGAAWYVGTDDNQVVIKAFPIEAPVEKPYWQFKKHHHH